MQIPSEISAVLCRIKDSGHEAYIVGGCVRDFMLGIAPHDFDVTTDMLPLEIAELFGDMHVIPTGLKHGTVTVVSNGMPVEITTFRTENGYSDGRHPDSVLFTRSLAEDLKRRDFTVNAMVMDACGNVTDLFCGVQDLQKGILRTVGDPSERFSEDALRILRLFRFASRFGFSVENNTAIAARELCDKLKLISRERILSELCGIVCGEYAAKALSLMVKCGIFDSVFVSPKISSRALNRIGTLPADANVRISALLTDDENAVSHIKSLKPPTDFIKRAEIYLTASLPLSNDKGALLRFINAAGVNNAVPAVLVASLKKDTDRDITELYSNIEELIEKETCFFVKDLKIGGEDAKAAGACKSEISALLCDTLFAVFDGEIPNERQAELKFIQNRLTKYAKT